MGCVVYLFVVRPVRRVRIVADVTQLVSSSRLSCQMSVHKTHTRSSTALTPPAPISLHPNSPHTCLSTYVTLPAAVGGYIVIVTHLHPETNDDDMTDAFTEFGNITTLHLNLDRRTGYVKGYALLEYAREEEARRAVEEGDGMVVMERQVKVDWAFKRGGGEMVVGGGGGGRERERERRGGKSTGVIRRDYRDLGADSSRGRDRGRESGRDRDRERDR